MLDTNLLQPMCNTIHEKTCISSSPHRSLFQKSNCPEKKKQKDISQPRLHLHAIPMQLRHNSILESSLTASMNISSILSFSLSFCRSNQCPDRVFSLQECPPRPSIRAIHASSNMSRAYLFPPYQLYQTHSTQIKTSVAKLNDGKREARLPNIQALILADIRLGLVGVIQAQQIVLAQFVAKNVFITKHYHTNVSLYAPFRK